ncbi:MAG: VOC family protein, partial [Bacteroidota bacterium]
IRSAKPEQLAAFYRLLGFEFVFHQHGNGPLHYSAELAGVVLEIYPLLPKQSQPDTGLRLGFVVEDLEACLAPLLVEEVVFVAKPKHSPWGYRCVIRDPEGRKIELVEPGIE